MHAHRMSPEELTTAVTSARTLLPTIVTEHPELALLLVDLMDLAALELLVHAVGGDRQLAERLHRQAPARRDD